MGKHALHSLASAAALALAACASVPTPVIRPTATRVAEFAATAIPAVTPTAIPPPTAPATSTTQPTLSPTPDFPFPRDAAGRAIGGNAPLLNYAPEMITGQPCPRVEHWTLKTVQLDGGAITGVVDDPCVIQNVLDDFAVASGFDPTWLTPEGMRDALKLYRSDAALSQVYGKFWFDSFIANGRYVETVARAQCDKPVLRLLNVARPIPTVNSNAFVVQVNYIVVAEGFGPFRCDFLDFGLGQPFPKRAPAVVTAASLQTDRAYSVWLAVAVWSAEAKHWQFQGSGPTPSYVDAARVRQLYAEGKVKPW